MCEFSYSCPSLFNPFHYIDGVSNVPTLRADFHGPGQLSKLGWNELEELSAEDDGFMYIHTYLPTDPPPLLSFFFDYFLSFQTPITPPHHHVAMGWGFRVL